MIRVERQAILIAGMHRSGTSAVARMVNLLGADLGQSFIPPKEDNERGFWENEKFLTLHANFLAQFDCLWHDPIRFPENWLASKNASQFHDTLAKLLESQFERSALFAVKDPRLSFLAPLWLPVLENLGIKATFILPVRHPHAVAASLEKRDGFSRAHSNMLWLQHLVESEAVSSKQSRVFVHYDALLTDWRTQLQRITTSLGIHWPVNTHHVEVDIDTFIDPSMRHHEVQLETELEPTMPSLLQKAYAAACAHANDRPLNPDQQFDALRYTYDQVMNLGGARILEATRQARKANRRHREEVTQAREVIESKQQEVGHAQENIEKLVHELEQARAYHDEMGTEIDHARRVIADKDAEIEKARYSADSLHEQIEQAGASHLARDIIEHRLRKKIRSMRQSLIYGIGLRKPTSEIIDARNVIAGQESEISLARTHNENLTSQLNSARLNIDKLIAELDAARTNINSLVEEIAQARRSHSARDVIEQSLRDELDQLRSGSSVE